MGKNGAQRRSSLDQFLNARNALSSENSKRATKYIRYMTHEVSMKNSLKNTGKYINTKHRFFMITLLLAKT